MKVEVKELSSVEKNIDVTLQWTEVEEKYNKIEKKLIKNFRLDGFRKGKVPKAIALKHLDPNIKYEFANEVISDTYLKVIEDQGYSQHLDAGVDKVDFDVNKDFTYAIKIQVDPEIKLCDYKKELSLTENVYEMSEKDIDLSLDSIRERYAEAKEISGESKDGHYILCDLTEADEQGNPIEDKKITDRVIKIGEGVFGKTGAKNLIGVKVNDTVNIYFGAENKKKVQYQVFVKRIEEHILPELTDEFVKTNIKEFETVDALKENIKTSLKQELTDRSNHEISTEIIDYFIKAIDVDIPPMRMEKFLTEVVTNYKNKNKTEDIDEDTLKSQNKDMAEREIKWFLIKDKLIAEENVKVTEEMIQQEIEKILQPYPEEQRKYMAQYYESNEMKSRLEFDLQEKTLFSKLKEYAKIKKVKVNTEDLRK